MKVEQHILLPHRATDGQEVVQHCSQRSNLIRRRQSKPLNFKTLGVSVAILRSTASAMAAIEAMVRILAVSNSCDRSNDRATTMKCRLRRYR
eukprot:scaffold1900_cov389-Prasinococcus_capsulatus_cf.AAC.30